MTNINQLLKSIKSENYADLIHSDNREIIITTNKVVLTLDMNTIKKYMKNLNDVDLNEVMSPRLPQLKSCLKILDILYFIKDTNFSVTVNIIEIVIKSTHIFNNTVLMS